MTPHIVLPVAAANGYSSYKTPQQQTRRPPEEGEFILTVKDVTASSKGSFAGHIVHGEDTSGRVHVLSS